MQLHFGLWILQTLLNYRDIIYSLTQIIYSSVITEIEHLYSTYDTPPRWSKNAPCFGLCHPPSTPGSMYYCLSHFTGVVTVHREASKSPNVTQWEVVKQCLNPGVWSQSPCSSTALLPHQGGLWPSCLKLHPEVGMFLRNNILSAVSGPVIPGHISRADPHGPSLKAI